MAVDASVNAVPAATPAEAHGDCPTIVDHGAQLLTMLRRMCTDKLLPDVILRVESKNCGAVRYVRATLCHTSATGRCQALRSLTYTTRATRRPPYGGKAPIGLTVARWCGAGTLATA